jgi:hypothetical protein
MKKQVYIILTLCILSISSVLGQKKVLLLNGFLHIGNEKTIETAAVGIVSGKISVVRNALAYSYSKEDWDTIIDLKGQHIYPGFVAANSTLGLTEIDAVRATRDFDEVGEFNPHIRAQIAYNAESKVIATVRTNGVLLTQTTPRGGQISGSSSVMATAGWNWEDATILADDGVHVNWPSAIQQNWEEDGVTRQKNESYEKEKAQLVTFFEMAQAHANLDVKLQSDVRLNAMTACFKGSKRVYFHADDIQQLLDVIDFAQKFKLPFPVIVGGYESYLVTRKLKDAKIPVMLNRIHSLPENETDPVDLPYRLPKLLQDAEVLFCLQPHGDMEAMNARNLPFYAGTAWAYGLTEEQAVASISKNVCEITGTSKNYGTIEEGKSATLFISKGNALDMRTNSVTLAYVNGERIDLLNTQEELYRKYLKKYQN